MSAEAVREKLESYARTKIASVLHPMTEAILIEQPVDPVSFMVRYPRISKLLCVINDADEPGIFKVSDL